MEDLELDSVYSPAHSILVLCPSSVWHLGISLEQSGALVVDKRGTGCSLSCSYGRQAETK